MRWMKLNTSLISLKNNLKIRMMDVLNDPAIHDTICKLVGDMEELTNKLQLDKNSLAGAPE